MASQIWEEEGYAGPENETRGIDVVVVVVVVVVDVVVDIVMMLSERQ